MALKRGLTWGLIFAGPLWFLILLAVWILK
jgi:hypothetical protein